MMHDSLKYRKVTGGHLHPVLTARFILLKVKGIPYDSSTSYKTDSHMIKPLNNTELLNLSLKSIPPDIVKVLFILYWSMA